MTPPDPDDDPPSSLVWLAPDLQPGDWDGDPAATVPAAWWLPESDRFAYLRASEPSEQPTTGAANPDQPAEAKEKKSPKAPPRKGRKKKADPNQSSFFTTEGAPSDGKYDAER